MVNDGATIKRNQFNNIKIRLRWRPKWQETFPGVYEQLSANCKAGVWRTKGLSSVA